MPLFVSTTRYNVLPKISPALDALRHVLNSPLSVMTILCFGSSERTKATSSDTAVGSYPWHAPNLNGINGSFSTCHNSNAG
ncbi:MAG: hypothetical protein AAB932_00730 [Patescibacteria group bacterium]